MNYLSAIDQATTEIGTTDVGGDDTAAQAALSLATHAWEHLAGRDPAWDLFAVGVLTAADLLFPVRAPVILTVDVPAADTAQLRLRLAGLVTAVADRYKAAVADTTHPSVRRLQYAAAAAQLRAAAGQLT